MQVPEEYRRNAAQCVQLARRAQSHASRMVLIDLAQAWLKLALLAHGATVRRSRDRAFRRDPPGSPAPAHAA